MHTGTNQTLLFGSEINPPVGWRSYATSMLVHVGLVILILLIPVVVTRDVRTPLRMVTTLIAPRLKPYKAPPVLQKPKFVIKSVIVPKPKQFVADVKPVIKPPIPREVPKPVPAPVIAAAEPKPLPKIVQEVAPAPALRPQVHTGLFASEEAAKKVEAAKQLKVGGFGDPNGVQANPDSTKPTLMAKVGAFEMPQGDGASGGRGGQGRGVVRQTAFGSGDGQGSGPGGNGAGIGHGTVRQAGFGAADGGNTAGGNGHGGMVKTGGFGESTPVAPQQVQRARPATPALTPVEILMKPRPIYTAEARAMHVEGEVSLEVIFTASGSVQVLRVTQGLGHGLDEAAEQAAAQIRFKPGTRDGSPVDTRATIRILFELT